MSIRSFVAVGLCLGLCACSSPTSKGESAAVEGAAANKNVTSDTTKSGPSVDGNAVAKGDTPKAATGHDEGCIHGTSEQEGCEAHAAPSAAGVGHFGAAFTSTEARALASAVEGAKQAPSEAPTLVSGEVTAVCQAKGCWMVLRDTADASVEARVIMKNHAFAVPFDGKGKAARVEGVLTSRTFTPAQVQHLAKDAGQDPNTVEAKPRTEWVLTATGVELAAG